MREGKSEASARVTEPIGGENAVLVEGPFLPTHFSGADRNTSGCDLDAAAGGEDKPSEFVVVGQR